MYCAIGFGNNFFYPFGSDALPIPPSVLEGGDEENFGHVDSWDAGGYKKETGGAKGDGKGDMSNDESIDHMKKSSGGTKPLVDGNGCSSDNDNQNDNYCGTTQAYLLPLKSNGSHTAFSSTSNHDQKSHSNAMNWIYAQLQQPQNTKSIKSDNKVEFGSTTLPITSCGATHTSFLFPKTNASPSGDAYILGTMFGRTYPQLTMQQSRLPLRIMRVSSGRRHVIALTEGATSFGSGESSASGGGVVLSWGAGHFGQLGHGPDVTSCLEPRIIERLLPQVIGGQVIEIAAGGLHSAAIVASSYSKCKKSNSGTTNNSNELAVDVRETKTFAWGSNRKGQCGIEGGKCATVPTPLPVVSVRREEIARREEGDGITTKLGSIDKDVYFEKLSLGRLHSVALTAHGEVFSWGSTSMGRCGHNMEGRGASADRRFCQEPRFVNALRNVAIEAIAAGDAHTLALSKGGRVFAWGAGSDGQCGQGHAGNLFSPRAVKEIHFSEMAAIESSFESLDNDQASGAEQKSLEAQSSSKIGISSNRSENEKGIPRISSNIAMEIAIEEEAVSKALSMTRTEKIPKSAEAKEEQITPKSILSLKSNKIITIRASGCYSAAMTSFGEVYTWGYAGESAIGHPIPVNGSCLPLLPLIEGNQYSSVTAAKVYPEGGKEEKIIRDCQSFDTDLNVMLPRKVECIQKLGLKVEDVSLGPGHMVILCSSGEMSGDDNACNGARADQTLSNDGSTNSVSLDCPNIEVEQYGTRGLEQGLTSLNDSRSGIDRVGSSFNTASTLGDAGSGITYESAENLERPKSEKRRSSPAWMMKMKSSRSTRSCSSQSLLQNENGAQIGSISPSTVGGKDKEKKKSFLPMSRILDVAFHRTGGK